MKDHPTLLIVDDNDVNLTLLEAMISTADINLIKALSGAEALKMVHGVELALAIIDVRMPIMDGFELAKKLNQTSSKDKVPIIFLTAWKGNKSAELEGYGSGAVDYLYKPINRNVLISKIKVFIDLYNQKQIIKNDAVKLKDSSDKLAWAFDALKQSEEKYKTMLNASPDGIFLINLDGEILEVSDIGVELLNANNKEEIIGNNFSLFVPTFEKKTIKKILKTTVNEGISQNVEMQIRKKNNSLFLSDISSTLIQDADGDPVLFMIILRDISFQKEIETRQIHADRMANLGQMASGIAHEINQPLNIISMVMDRILFDTSKTGAIKYELLKGKSDKIFENITRISNIIDQVRIFSRSHDNYILTEFDINTAIENASSMLTEQFKQLQINLDIALDKEIPYIIGNTHKFEQVIINLLVNAKDAVIERSEKQKEYSELIIGIKTWQEGQFIVAEITDNGIGFDNVGMQKAMIPFYTTKEEGKGTGLGLSICYQIIKEMNGKIDISSERYVGTKIKLMIDTKRKN